MVIHDCIECDNGNEVDKDHLVPGEVDAVHIGLGGTEVVLCHTVQPENINHCKCRITMVQMVTFLPMKKRKHGLQINLYIGNDNIVMIALT